MIGLVTVLALALTAPNAVVSQTPPQAAPAPTGSLRDVAFMSGHWVDGSDVDRSEEMWTEVAGDSMLGMWRLVAGGRVRVMELLMLKEENGGVVLRFRHFNPLLVAREDRTTPIVLRLARVSPNEARFEGPTVDGSGAMALTYRRPTADTLEATLERGGKTERFSFRRR